uniref:CSON013462 protein n=1 Tax=Culicoides sonorensis TaxID=179676 RepID=A0A336MAY6_CULSO
MFECIQCDSRQNLKCNKPDTSLSQICRAEGPSHCFTQVSEDGHVTRGCQNDLSSNAFNQCSTSTNLCELCDFDNCNTFKFPYDRIVCHHCDETILGSKCQESMKNVTSPCKIYKVDDKCIKRKHGDHTIRQCLSDYPKCYDDKSCEICEADECDFKSQSTIEMHAGNYSIFLMGFYQNRIMLI